MVVQRKKLSPPQVAKVWGVSAAKVVGFIKSGELRATNLATDLNGRPRYVVDLDDIARFEEARQVVPQSESAPQSRLRRKPTPGVKEFV